MRGSWVRVPSLAWRPGSDHRFGTRPVRSAKCEGRGTRALSFQCPGLLASDPALRTSHFAHSASSSMPPSRSHDPYAALRHGDFRWYVLSVMAVTGGAQIWGVLVAWPLYVCAHDPLVLGLIGLAEALPFIAAALFAGPSADPSDRRAIAL